VAIGGHARAGDAGASKPADPGLPTLPNNTPHQPERKTQVKFASIALALIAFLFAPPALPQGADKPADNFEVLRAKLKADKKLLVAANMELTESEAKAFWPVYEAYQKDLQAINERTGKLILAYAQDFKSNAVTDEKAKKYTDELLAIQESEVKLMRSYVPKLGKVLPARKVARYLQIENKVRAVVRFELADAVPLVP
jgi:hypothetical protein